MTNRVPGQRPASGASSGRFHPRPGQARSRAHVTRRFSIAVGARQRPRLREYILALRAIWASWNEGARRLDFRGTYYRHTLMNRPCSGRSPTRTARPRVFLAAAVGTGHDAGWPGRSLTGCSCMASATERYLREGHAGPALQEGPGRDPGRSRAAVEVTLPRGFRDHRRTARGDLADRNQRGTPAQIAFYGRPRLRNRPVARSCMAGASVADRLHDLSVGRDEGRWRRWASSSTDDVLAAFHRDRPRPEEAASELKRPLLATSSTG